MIDILSFKGFYPMLFTTIGIISLALIFAVKAILIKFKDTDSKNFLFKTHVEEHTDTTSKMAQMHDNVIKVDFTEKHEKEFDSLERGLKDLDNKVKDLKIQVDKLIERVIELENNR